MQNTFGSPFLDPCRFLFFSSSQVFRSFITRAVFSILSMNLDRMIGILFDCNGLLLPSGQGRIQTNFLIENRVCELPHPCPDK